MKRLAVLPFALAASLLWTFYVVQPPGPAGVTLGPSWQLALTLAAHDHLQFGRDIVFTFGPLGYVLVGVADPALAPWSIAITLVLMLVVVTAVSYLLAARASIVQRLAFVAVLGLVSSTLSFDYIVLLGIVALLARAARVPRLAPAVGIAVGAAALFGALSKYTLAVDVLAAASATWAVDVVAGPARRRRAALLAGGIALAIVTFGVASAMGFSPSAIASYLHGAASISSGYSWAMAVGGPRSEVALALVVAAAILGVGALAWRERKRTLAPLAAVVLFLAWKHGFVRQDAHILIYFATAAGLAAVLLVAVRRVPARALALAATALATGAFLFSVRSQNGSFAGIIAPDRVAVGARYVFSPIATQTRLASLIPQQLAPDRLAPSLVASIGGSTVDVLPSETAIVAANALRWDPLPVFQAYSAYTPFLDQLNREALVERGAQTILYDYGAIDGRYPFGEMPATTVEIACRYRAVSPALQRVDSLPYALLKRVSGGCVSVAAAADAAGTAIGRPITVPAPSAPSEMIVARVALRPTVFTAVMTQLWRAPPAFVEMTFADGTTKRWRLVTPTASDGMIVSPAPRDPAEAAVFLAGGATAVVRSITVTSRAGAYVLDSVRFTRLRRRL